MISFRISSFKHILELLGGRAKLHEEQGALQHQGHHDCLQLISGCQKLLTTRNSVPRSSRLENSDSLCPELQTLFSAWMCYVSWTYFGFYPGSSKYSWHCEPVNCSIVHKKTKGQFLLSPGWLFRLSRLVAHSVSCMVVLFLQVCRPARHLLLCGKVGIQCSLWNIAKGTTDPRVKFISETLD